MAAAGFLFLTVVSVLVQFAILGVITAIVAVGIVAFDSWVNRPKGLRATRRADTGWQTGGSRGTGSRANSAVNRARPPAQNFRTGPRPTTAGQPRRQPPPQQRQPNGQPPRQPMRPPQGQPRQQPPRQPPPQGQPPVGQPPVGQPPQGQPPRPPFRPSPPDPGRTRRPADGLRG